MAMVYLSEEIEPRAGGSAMDLHIAGNAFGGMAGGILTACVWGCFFFWSCCRPRAISSLGVFTWGSSPDLF